MKLLAAIVVAGTIVGVLAYAIESQTGLNWQCHTNSQSVGQTDTNCSFRLGR